MLFLVFRLGQDHYALDTAQLAEVLPMIPLKSIPRAPAPVAGVFDYHGVAVPVIDLSELALGRPAPPRLSTRLLVARYPDPGREPRLLGLLAEHATGTVRREASDFEDTGVSSEGAPYLGPVTRHGDKLLQRIDVEMLIPEALRALLFGGGLEAR